MKPFFSNDSRSACVKANFLTVTSVMCFSSRLVGLSQQVSDVVGQHLGRRAFGENARVQADPVVRFEFGQRVDQGQRGAAEVEEIVVQAYARQAQLIAPDLQDLALFRAQRGLRLFRRGSDRGG